MTPEQRLKRNLSRRTPEYLAVQKLIGEHDIHPVCVDFGARLAGSNVIGLIKDHHFDAILVEKNPAHARVLTDTFPNSDVRNISVTPDNVNDIVPERVGVLSCDIDGNDYHVWKALEKSPQIVIIEIGRKKHIERKGRGEYWIPPYIEGDPKRFDGACKQAMVNLGASKGYSLHAEMRVNLIFVHDSLHSTA